MARYPIFKPGEEVSIRQEIWRTVHDGHATRMLEAFGYRGMVRRRIRHSRGQAPIYGIVVGSEEYSIYANFLEKVEPKKKKWRII